ncbi:MAG: response regulator [Myxococcales bacterium]|nr:response regulator [Myxococcales bacterium]
MTHTRVLVVDDDANVGRFLSRTLRRLGFTVKTALSVAEAWPLIQNEPFDLLLIDKTMPQENGLVLLKRLQDSEFDIPAVMITGDATVETIDEALCLGAEDYISKPFASASHLTTRLRSVLDRRTSELLFDVMFGDLSKAVMSGTGQSMEFTHLSQSLLDLKLKLGKRPACAVIDDDASRRELRRNEIYNSGVIAVGVAPADIEKCFEGEREPMVAAVSLESIGSLERIAELRRDYPNLTIVACTSQADVSTGLTAIESGATDFVLLQEEGISAATQRIDRLVRQARRHHLYLEIVCMLYRAACEVRPDLAEDLIFATSVKGRQN